MPVKQLLKEVDSQELTDWRAFERLEPFGSMITNYQLATLTSLIHNIILGLSKSKTTSSKAEHYILGDAGYLGVGVSSESKKQTPEEMKEIIAKIPGIRKGKKKKRKQK